MWVDAADVRRRGDSYSRGWPFHFCTATTTSCGSIQKKPMSPNVEAMLWAAAPFRSRRNSDAIKNAAPPTMKNHLTTRVILSADSFGHRENRPVVTTTVAALDPLPDGYPASALQQ